MSEYLCRNNLKGEGRKGREARRGETRGGEKRRNREEARGGREESSEEEERKPEEERRFRSRES